MEKSAEDKVIDIDADTSDPVTVSEYTNEIFVNMKRREVCSPTFILMPCSSLVVTPKSITHSLEAVAFLNALGPDEQIELSRIPHNSGAKLKSRWTWYYSRLFIHSGMWESSITCTLLMNTFEVVLSPKISGEFLC